MWVSNKMSILSSTLVTGTYVSSCVCNILSGLVENASTGLFSIHTWPVLEAISFSLVPCSRTTVDTLSFYVGWRYLRDQWRSNKHVRRLLPWSKCFIRYWDYSVRWRRSYAYHSWQLSQLNLSLTCLLCRCLYADSLVLSGSSDRSLYHSFERSWSIGRPWIHQWLKLKLVPSLWSPFIINYHREVCFGDLLFGHFRLTSLKCR